MSNITDSIPNASFTTAIARLAETSVDFTEEDLELTEAQDELVNLIAEIFDQPKGLVLERVIDAQIERNKNHQRDLLDQYGDD